MDTITTIAFLSLAIRQIESSKNTMIEVKDSDKKLFPYNHKASNKKFKNPRSKMGHPIIQPRGQNH
jgi:hypothetical protein